MGHGLRMGVAVALGLAMAGQTATAQTLQEQLQDPSQKRAFQRALHQLFVDEPQLLVPPAPQTHGFSAHAARDKALLKGAVALAFCAKGGGVGGPRRAS